MLYLMNLKHKYVEVVIQQISGCKEETVLKSVLDSFIAATSDDLELADVLSDQLYLLNDVDAPLRLNLESSCDLVLLQVIVFDVLEY